MDSHRSLEQSTLCVLKTWHLYLTGNLVTQWWPSSGSLYTVYPKKYAHGFVVLCFVVVMQSFIMNSHEVFIHIHQGCFAGTGAIVRLPQCQWSKPDGYGKISQCITTTKQSKNRVHISWDILYIRLVRVKWKGHQYDISRTWWHACSKVAAYQKFISYFPWCWQDCVILYYFKCRLALFDNRIE